MRAYLIWIVLAAGLAALLFSNHATHLLGYLPLLIILACPLHHLFQRHHSGHSPQRDSASAASTER